MTTVDVFYRCSCMTDEGSLEVPERLPTMELEEWLDVVRTLLYRHHAPDHPSAEQKITMTYVKLPCRGEPPYGIGFRARLDS